jgi:hypothetical protein
MKYDEIIKQCPSSGSGVHSWMLAVSNIGAREERQPQDVVFDIRQSMTRPENPSSEVESTVRKAFGEKGSSYTVEKVSAEERILGKERLEKMRSKLFIDIADGEAKGSDLEKISPVRVDTESGYEPHMAAKLLLYMYDRKEKIWCGDKFTKGEGVDTVESWAERFLCLDEPPPFFIPNPVTGETGKAKSGTLSYRCDETIAEWRYALFEVDLEDVSLGHQASFWIKMINNGEMPIESVTYSGGKSLHALIRVDCKSEAQWDKVVRNGAFAEWIKIGADKTCRNPSRLSRLPGHKREGKTLQRLLWLRGGK